MANVTGGVFRGRTNYTSDPRVIGGSCFVPHTAPCPMRKNARSGLRAVGAACPAQGLHVEGLLSKRTPKCPGPSGGFPWARACYVGNSNSPQKNKRGEHGHHSWCWGAQVCFLKIPVDLHLGRNQSTARDRPPKQKGAGVIGISLGHGASHIFLPFNLDREFALRKRIELRFLNKKRQVACGFCNGV